jgi:large subunit ribosomal protein L22
VYKTLRSAVANAVNNDGAKVSALYVDEAFVGRSFTLKRFMARGRGRSSAIHKPFSHLSILISERDFEEED